MGNVVKKIFGGGSKPKASEEPKKVVEEEGRKAKNSRAALFETEGGVAGSELQGDEVKRRKTLLGN